MIKDLVVHKCFSGEGMSFLLASTSNKEFFVFKNITDEPYTCESVGIKHTESYITDWSLLTTLKPYMCYISHTGLYIPEYGNYVFEERQQYGMLVPYFNEALSCLPDAPMIHYFVSAAEKLHLNKYFAQNTVWLIPPKNILYETLSDVETIGGKEYARRIMLNHCASYTGDDIITFTGFKINDISVKNIIEEDKFTLIFLNDIIADIGPLPDVVKESFCISQLHVMQKEVKDIMLKYRDKEKDTFSSMLEKCNVCIDTDNVEKYEKCRPVLLKIATLINNHLLLSPK